MARPLLFEFPTFAFTIGTTIFLWTTGLVLDARGAASPVSEISEKRGFTGSAVGETGSAAHGETDENPAGPSLEDLDFVLPSLSGERMVLSQLLAKGPVLLAFFATWCPPCVDEIPYLNLIQKSFGPRGLTVVGVDIGESELKVRRFAERHGIRYLVALDRESEVADQYAVLGIPTSVLIDREGRVRFRGFGLPSELVLTEVSG